MKKGYMVVFILVHILYWTLVLDQVEGLGRPVSVLMILLSLLIEILLLKNLRRESQSIRLKSIFFVDLLSGLEWLLFFSLIIKALTQEMSFYNATIECSTFFFISVVSLFLIPKAVRDKTLINSKYTLIVLGLFLSIDRILIGLPLDSVIRIFYVTRTFSVARSNLSILMFVAWIINVEYVKKQLVIDKV